MQQRLLDLIAFKSLIKKSTICINKTSKALKISRVSFGEKMVTRLLRLWAWRNSAKCKFDIKRKYCKCIQAPVYFVQKVFQPRHHGIHGSENCLQLLLQSFNKLDYIDSLCSTKASNKPHKSNLNYRTIGFTAIFYIQWMVLSHFHDVATPAADNVAVKEWPVLV